MVEHYGKEGNYVWVVAWYNPDTKEIKIIESPQNSCVHPKFLANHISIILYRKHPDPYLPESLLTVDEEIYMDEHDLTMDETIEFFLKNDVAGIYSLHTTREERIRDYEDDAILEIDFQDVYEQFKEDLDNYNLSKEAI